MKEIASCCEGDYHVGPPPKAVQKPDSIFIITSQQHEITQAQEKKNEKMVPK